MDAVLIGETVAAASRTGPLRMARTLELSIAGAESNAAIGLARLGFEVAWVGRVGDDELGAFVIERLRGMVSVSRVPAPVAAAAVAAAALTSAIVVAAQATTSPQMISVNGAPGGPSTAWERSAQARHSGC